MGRAMAQVVKAPPDRRDTQLGTVQSVTYSVILSLFTERSNYTSATLGLFGNSEINR
jgi:hypothetical protein